MRGTEVNLRSQQIFVAGMLRPAHLLDLMRNFTVFQQVGGKTHKVVARYQQFRASTKLLAGFRKAVIGIRALGRRARRDHLAHPLLGKVSVWLPGAQDRMTTHLNISRWSPIPIAPI